MLAVLDPPLEHRGDLPLLMEKAEEPERARGVDATRAGDRVQQRPGRVSFRDRERGELDAPPCVPARGGSPVVLGVDLQDREASGEPWRPLGIVFTSRLCKIPYQFYLRIVCKTEGMDVPTGSADVLAQPTRARLFALLEELARPAGTDELARTLDLNVNGVRAHLERLREAGLIERERERHGRGRPRDTWSISADASPGGTPPSGYVDLGRWLTRVLAGGKSGVRDVEAIGRQIGRELAGDTASDAVEPLLYARLVAMGFQPRRSPDRDRTLTYELANCPYRDAVREDQAVVCGLHRGLTRGLLDVLSPQTELAAFIPKDPFAAGCLITLRGPLAEQAACSDQGCTSPRRIA